MWSKLLQLFSRNRALADEARANDATFQELQAVKKLLRKQTIFLEKMREGLLEQTEKQIQQDLQPLLSFADAFFYLDQSLRQAEVLSPQRQQALEMVWDRLDELLSGAEVAMIRQKDVAFDARLHEAIENSSPGDGQFEVLRMLQPGFLHRGKVVKAAKVIIGKTEISELLSEGVNY